MLQNLFAKGARKILLLLFFCCAVSAPSCPAHAEEKLPDWLVAQINHRQGLFEFSKNLRKALEKAPDWFYSDAMTKAYGSYYILRREAKDTDPFSVISLNPDKPVSYMVSEIYFRNAKLFNQFCLGDLPFLFDRMCAAQPQFCHEFQSQYSFAFSKVFAEKRAKEKTAAIQPPRQAKTKTPPSDSFLSKEQEESLKQRLKGVRKSASDLAS